MWFYRGYISLWGALPIVLAIMTLRRASRHEVMRFCARYGVEATPETIPAITRYVRRGRSGRLIGIVIGLCLNPVLYALGLTIPNDSAFYGVLGYLIGAFVAALIPIARASGLRSASLTQRRLRDYLPRLALLGPVVGAGVGALAVVIYELEPRRDLVTDAGGAFGGLVVSVIAALVTFIAIRIVVAQPQPIISRDLAAVDDAMRTQTLHTLGGAGMAIALLGAGSCLFQMSAYASSDWLHEAGMLAGFAALMGAVAAWVFMSAGWQVPRANLR